jgi:hypothetical protein
MGAQAKFDLWRKRKSEYQLLGPMPDPQSSTIIEAMAATQREKARAYDQLTKLDCDRRLGQILKVYESSL